MTDTKATPMSEAKSMTAQPSAGAQGEATASDILRWIETHPHPASWLATAKDIREIVERLGPKATPAQPDTGDVDCFECLAPLVGPFCPECNPAIKAALGYAVETPDTGDVAALREGNDYSHLSHLITPLDRESYTEILRGSHYDAYIKELHASPATPQAVLPRGWVMIPDNTGDMVENGIVGALDCLDEIASAAWSGDDAVERIQAFARREHEYALATLSKPNAQGVGS